VRQIFFFDVALQAFDNVLLAVDLREMLRPVLLDPDLSARDSLGVGLTHIPIEGLVTS
jgi:hypothetical protein